jgi:hypothetical protein
LNSEGHGLLGEVAMSRLGALANAMGAKTKIGNWDAAAN